MKVGGEGVVLAGGTDTLKCMKPRGDTVDFLQAEIVGTCGNDCSDNIQRHTTSIIFQYFPYFSISFHQNLIICCFFFPAAEVTEQIQVGRVAMSCILCRDLLRPWMTSVILGI